MHESFTGRPIVTAVAEWKQVAQLGTSPAARAESDGETNPWTITHFIPSLEAK